ncbi:MAG: hypothetical protein ACI82A_001530 [Candidatus Azotimanducaceae bacterium]|jgi:hypothetical protein
MFTPEPILLPVVCLVVWTLIQLVWMASVRLPAISAAKLGPDAGQNTIELGTQLPKEVQWKADNYNHLLEQPTAFYACALALALAGAGDGLNLYLAWAYVGIRVVHSIVHSTSNKVMIRFGLFMLSSIVLLAMAVNAVRILAF